MIRRHREALDIEQRIGIVIYGVIAGLLFTPGNLIGSEGEHVFSRAHPH